MKVTVCFGSIRVVVPCGEGTMTIANLQKEACSRYRKIINKSLDYCVRINQLGSAIDGGILDWDDLVKDVIEDKEKLIAVYDEEGSQQEDWDFGSIVSLEARHLPPRTSIKSNYELTNGISDSRFVDHGSLSSSHYSRDSSLEVDVGIDALKSSSQIVVRRESDMSFTTNSDRNLTSLQVASISQSGEKFSDGKAFSQSSPKYSRKTSHNCADNEENNNKILDRNDKNTDGKTYFRRDKFRQSMASGLSESMESGGNLYQEPERNNSYNKPFHSNLGDNARELIFADRFKLPWFYKESQEITLINDGRILGFQVDSYYDEQINKFIGLLVNEISPGSRVDREKLLQSGDVIVEINNRILHDQTSDMAHAILKESLHCHELQLRILPVEERDRFTPSIRAKPAPSLKVTLASPPTNGSMLEGSHISVSASSVSTHESSNSPLSKVPLIAQQSYDNVSLYTRKIGNQIEISFKKESQGLGFSITTRDTTTADDPGPIYIKNILPKGAAIVDGRLRAGDRLLTVNGQELTGLTQDEAVMILRSVQPGSIVNLTVSRQCSETLPRKLQDDPLTDQIISEDNIREYFMYEIPLNDTGSAGLGISLKGNQSKKTGKDLGIFVKSVFHGGAAWQDGRLQSNDQLIQVNGRSLTGVSNHEAIEILRASMSTEGNVRGMIQMVIARRKTFQDGISSRISSEASSDLSDSILEHLHHTGKTANEIVNTEPLDNKLTSQQEIQYEGSFRSLPSPTYQKNVSMVSNNLVTEVDWPLSPSHDPFQRESIVRQSVSEKRREVVTRFLPSNDILKLSTKPNTDKESNETQTRKKSSHVRNLSSPILLNKSKITSKNINNSSSAGEHPNKQLTIKESLGISLNSKSATIIDESDRHCVNGFRKSISTESLVASANYAPNTPLNSLGNKYIPFSRMTGSSVDVGPSLGIAKSSSLESLQTAVESCIAENHTDNPFPRALPRVVRGRVLNDSFRAALDRSYDMSTGAPTIKQMETVNEEGNRKTTLVTIEERNPLNKKRQNTKATKLFGLFKINKSKRLPDNPAKHKVAENELHKQHLEARREKDFERMKEENERIQAKARELRNRQAEEQQRSSSNLERPRPPSVPVTSMQRIKNDEPSTWQKVSSSGRHSVDLIAMRKKSFSPTNEKGFPFLYPPTESQCDPSPPPRSVKHLKKDEHRKFMDNSNHYSSLPRQQRRPSCTTDDETPASTSKKGYSKRSPNVVSNLNGVGSTRKQTGLSKFDNLEFYNRQKPTSTHKKLTDSQQTLPISSELNPVRTRDRETSANTGNIKIDKMDVMGRTIFYDDTHVESQQTVHSTEKRGFHRREQSPEPPPQSFYVIRTPKPLTKQPTRTVVSRNAPSPASREPRWIQPSNHRHSVYTDSPSFVGKKPFSHTHLQARSPSFQSASWTLDRSVSGQDRRSSSPTTSEVAKKNRQAFHKFMQLHPHSNRDGDSNERIEVSAQYDL